MGGVFGEKERGEECLETEREGEAEKKKKAA